MFEYEGVQSLRSKGPTIQLLSGGGGGGGGDFEKKFLASACRKKEIARSTNVIESLWGKKGKKYPAHQIARKKILDDQKSPTLSLKS